MDINRHVPEPIESYQKVRVYTQTGRIQVIREQVMLTAKAAEEYNSLDIKEERDMESYTIKFQKNT